MRNKLPDKQEFGSKRSGFTLIEVVVAVALLLIVFFGLGEVYSRGRKHLNYEEDRRKATAVAQARLDGIRRDFRFDDLAGLAGADTTYIVDNRSYTVHHDVQVGVPEIHAATLTLTVTWRARLTEGSVDRSHSCTTILGRGLPWSS